MSIIKKYDEKIRKYEQVITNRRKFTNNRLFISGRTLEGVRMGKVKNGNALKNRLTFLDENNFTSTYRERTMVFPTFP